MADRRRRRRPGAHARGHEPHAPAPALPTGLRRGGSDGGLSERVRPVLAAQLPAPPPRLRPAVPGAPAAGGLQRHPGGHPSLVRRAHEAGLRIDVWTINAESDMRRLLDWGVDGIMTDRPDVLARVLSGS
ncbi:glycerophosphodiester phosphodiesterase [Kocuria sp. NPDC057446]|uniref:glycerophosphodiester phosphodiesterase n=1 Tax=Kocuria sp. NPDC057446 TaxID=3346137 RepID=UPI0036C1A9C9